MTISRSASPALKGYVPKVDAAAAAPTIKTLHLLARKLVLHGNPGPV
jgi:hypothetical protein